MFVSSLSKLLLFSAVFMVSGCGSLGTTAKPLNKAGGTVTGAMARAADTAAKSGMANESLALNEKLYQRDPRNPDYILAYSRNLRRVGRLDDAILVVRTPANGKKATEPLITECAMVLVAQGQYLQAQKFAEKAVYKNPKSPDAKQALALAFSGLGDHFKAQQYFQDALDLWPEGRDKTPVINNLAMSQAAQGKVLEARSTMALATGEALSSPVYQNNRSFLASLNVADVADVELDAGVPQSPRAPMQPVDDDNPVLVKPAVKPPIEITPMRERITFKHAPVQIKMKPIVD
jgi:Flp pilus assembly protein TadD